MMKDDDNQASDDSRHVANETCNSLLDRMIETYGEYKGHGSKQINGNHTTPAVMESKNQIAADVAETDNELTESAVNETNENQRNIGIVYQASASNKKMCCYFARAHKEDKDMDSGDICLVYRDIKCNNPSIVSEEKNVWFFPNKDVRRK